MYVNLCIQCNVTRHLNPNLLMLKNQAPYRLHEVKKYPFEKGKTIKTEKLS